MLDDMGPATAAGLRRSTEDGRRATALADGYCGLPEGVTRWRLAAALRAAARPLGLTGPMLRLLEHYIDLTYDQDWEADSEPVVTRPLVEIAEHMGRSERQMRNVERALAARGLLAWRDSGNHHRKGRRDRHTGRLIYAYGPSLAPLGARATEIIACATAARAEIAASRRMRIAISALRRRIRAELAAAQAAGVVVDDLAAAFAQTPERAVAGLALSALSARRDALIALADALSTRLGPTAPLETQDDGAHDGIRDSAAKAEISGPHNADTCTKHAMNDACIVSETGKDGGGAPAAAGASRPWRPAQSPTDGAADRQGGRDHGVRAIPLAVAVAAAGPELRAALARQGEPSWTRLVEAARETAPLLGVDAAGWGEACGALGRYGAALAVLILERGAMRAGGQGVAAIRRPPAYLRGMLARARDGALHLDRSVRAWAQRAETDGRDRRRVEDPVGAP